ASPAIRTRPPRPPCAAVRRSRRRASSRSRPTRGGGVVGDGDRTSMRDLVDGEQMAQYDAKSDPPLAYTDDGPRQAERHGPDGAPGPPGVSPTPSGARFAIPV